MEIILYYSSNRQFNNFVIIIIRLDFPSIKGESAEIQKSNSNVVPIIIAVFLQDYEPIAKRRPPR